MSVAAKITLSESEHRLLQRKFFGKNCPFGVLELVSAALYMCQAQEPCVFLTVFQDVKCCSSCHPDHRCAVDKILYLVFCAVLLESQQEILLSE